MPAPMEEVQAAKARGQEGPGGHRRQEQMSVRVSRIGQVAIAITRSRTAAGVEGEALPTGLYRKRLSAPAPPV